MLDGSVSIWRTTRPAANSHHAQKPMRSCHRLPIVMGGTLNLISHAHAESGTNDLPMYVRHSQVNRNVVTFLFLILRNVCQCSEKCGIIYLRLRNNLEAGQSRCGHGFQIGHAIHQHNDQWKCGEEANQHCHNHDLWNTSSRLGHLFPDVDDCIHILAPRHRQYLGTRSANLPPSVAPNAYIALVMPRTHATPKDHPLLPKDDEVTKDAG